MTGMTWGWWYFRCLDRAHFMTHGRSRCGMLRKGPEHHGRCCAREIPGHSDLRHCQLCVRQVRARCKARPWRGR